MQENCEENQQIKQENPMQSQNQQDESKDIKKNCFTIKCKWISFSVAVLLFASIGVFLGIYLSQIINTAPTLKKFQKDEFRQLDEICMYHTSDKIQNCTQIEINTKRVVNDVNEKNASSLLMLTELKVKTFKQNPDGTREYNEMINENTEIEQQLNKQLRILQQKIENNNFCERISKNECGNLNEVPLVTVITDQQTGAVQQIGIPSGISDLILQPLVSNIIHIAPNIAEQSSTIEGNGTRLLNENYKNLYYVGKQAFVPKISKSKSWFGKTIVKKTVSQSDQIEGGSQGINLFDMFEQSQETYLDDNNYLVSSHITTNSKLDNTVKSEDGNQNNDDLTNKSETEITNESNLVTIETKTDEDLKNALSEIQTQQKIEYYSIEGLQDRIQQNENSGRILQPGDRLLQDENGDISSSSQTQQENQEGDCNSTLFKQKRTLKEATILKQKIGLEVEFNGQLIDQNISGYLKSCISLNSYCIQELYKKDFSYERKPVKPFSKSGSHSQNIFQVMVLIMGYPLNIGADYNYSWGFNESPIQTEREIGLSGQIYASLGVTAYGELSLVHIISIRAGVQGYIFKGSVNGVAQFKYNNVDKVIETKKYIIFLDFQIEVLTFDVYASYQHIRLEWMRKCVGRRWWKVCWYIPKVSFSDWKDIYRKSFMLANIQPTQRIFQIKSKCY